MKHQNAGCGGHDDAAQTLQQALARITAEISPVEGFELLATRDALDRVLYAPIHSTVDVPAHTNSAMDGYALAGAQLPGDGSRAFRVIGTAWAGRPFDGTAGEGECVRIMTGATVPAGTDTVVMQEQVQRESDTAIIGTGHKPGQNVRFAGEDLKAGAIALDAGVLLRPAHLGLIASLGVGEVRVRRRPRVAFFSTGDELASIGETLGPGQIYDSNRYTLYGMLQRLGVEVIDLGVVRDRREDLEQAFLAAAAQADAVITSGGVSVGEADFVTETLDRIGEVGFWTVAIKPGRPIAFGRVGGALFFGLPGNPVSVMVTFYQLVQPALQRLKGLTAPEIVPRVTATLTTPLRKKAGRREFQRGLLSVAADGGYRVEATGRQGSGILRSMAHANCFIVLPEDCGSLDAETEVEVQPFAALC
ncbi:gephyrin-like molybdotransferase Glp [Wenzhouxiangella sp. XN24]|uniref:molybdopterin molybdotransferase MoeA n=1 Tax=Wenzhouxiangella sp. XN24 TaxID=2713569 RepID=UPI0013ED7611|nr:gephyrin-like molybdotransferase Glp [Wenzhouxiangella sp. XN24]NGX14945.1 molybdopterin molybdotransferase MoeA [Wenzhouxiangella sp. XN24]